MALFFEELKVGDLFTTPSRTMTEGDVMAFAGLTGDYNEIHTSVEYAKATPFGERLVHGLLGLGVSHGLMFRLGILDGTGVAFIGIEDWKFKAPLLIGNTVRTRVAVLEKRLSRSRPGTGIVRFNVQLVGSEDVVLQEGVQVILMRCQGAQA